MHKILQTLKECVDNIDFANFVLKILRIFIGT